MAVEVKPPTRARRAWRVLRWPVWTVLALYVALVAYRVPAMFDKQKTTAAVAFMQSQKLDWATATGKNVPDAPDEALNNATLLGTDTNHNGIRDDVELAINKLHPNQAAVRAAELQYALELQLELSQVFNTDTWVAEAKYEAHGIDCLVEAAHPQYFQAKEWMKETEDLVFNTEKRKLKRQFVGIFESAFVSSDQASCDIDPKTFAA